MATTWFDLVEKQNIENKAKEQKQTIQEATWFDLIDKTIGEEIPIKNKVQLNQTEDEEIFSDDDIKGHFTNENFSIEKDKSFAI